MKIPASFSHLPSTVIVLLAVGVLAGMRMWGDGVPPPNPKTAREALSDPREVERWVNPKGFEKDVFTFVRLRYGVGGRFGRYNQHRWATDYPDADLNLSFRLQQMTSMKVDPDTRVLRITDPDLSRFPFVYTVEPGDMLLTDQEVKVMRAYLLNGGFWMADDFWGEAEWEGYESQMRRVFPDRTWKEIPRSDPLFHCVFDLPESLNLQCPNVRLGAQSEFTGITWERPDAKEVHVRGWFDDHGRLCALATHNTDNGDGWEREGESEYYFREFAEKKAYPLFINILFWVMTH
jgi:Domain of unknown function (DUF4159)